MMLRNKESRSCQGPWRIRAKMLAGNKFTLLRLMRAQRVISRKDSMNNLSNEADEKYLFRNLMILKRNFESELISRRKRTKRKPVKNNN